MSASSQSPAPWNIYADELRHHPHGYPLWMPDPDPSTTEVQLGDVGWLHDGGFYRLFNSMKAEGEPQVQDAVPSGFKPFCPPPSSVVGPREKIWEPILCGRGVNQVVEVSTSIIDYMCANFHHWVEFANSTTGLGLKDEEILFVCGTMKTDRWAVAAFCGEAQRTEGSFTAKLASLGEASVSMSISSKTPPVRYYRMGPSQRPSVSETVPPATQESSPSPQATLPSEQRDQYIFMNYYKMKRRFFWKPFPMKAAGGVHSGSGPGSEEDSEGDLMVVDEFDRPTEEWGNAPQYIDPVNSTASYAVACDLDVYRLFKEPAKNFQSFLTNIPVGAIWPDDTDHGVLFTDPEGRQSMLYSHPTPPVAIPPHSPALSTSSTESAGPSIPPPLLPWAPYYSAPTQAPIQYQPNSATAVSGNPESSPAWQQIWPTDTAPPYPVQAIPTIYIDDAATKQSDYIHRRCHNCRMTDATVWRRSTLTPGKVACNKCGIYERTHERPRPEAEFLYQKRKKSGAAHATTQFKQHHDSTLPTADSSDAEAEGSWKAALLGGMPGAEVQEEELGAARTWRASSVG
ncbi:hypothetical protein V8D89_002016 [Ganoderma adspersum]